MNIRQFSKLSDTPEVFFKAIPREPRANAQFRLDLHPLLARDKGALATYLALSFLDPACFFDTSYWLPNPRGKAGERTVPFILYPHQIPAVRELKLAIDDSYDVNIDKSRDEGATFLICGMFTLYWLIQDGFTTLFGSRIEDLVDRSTEIVGGAVSGNEQSLFYKLLYLLNSVPIYLQPKYTKSHMFLQNLDNGSAHSGQATSAGFGKGSRATVIGVDELAAVEPKIAQCIIENIADVAACCIFNSTQGDWGAAHPYAKLLTDERTKKIVLDWKSNPNKNKGLYQSPKDGQLIIHDIAYYRERWPDAFGGIEPDAMISGEQVTDTYPFILDGGVSNFNQPRSVWYDAEEKRPGRTQRGLAQNVLRIPAGSSDLYFSFGLIERLRDQTRQPEYQGDIAYTLDEANQIRETWFEPGGANSPLVWWGELKQGRPFQGNNYTVGCDLSKGTGTSNSVAAVVDVNTNEVVGLLVTPYLSITDFAEKVVALCEWVGGNSAPLLIFEENGAPDFLKRLDSLGYYSLWIKENKAGQKLKAGNRYGWRSTAGPNGTKVEVLNGLDAALHEGLKEEPRFPPLKIYDEQSINELGSYVWYEGKVDIGPASAQTETSGAKAAHGDRVIAISIANLARKQSEPGSGSTQRYYSEDSWQARRDDREQRDAKQKEWAKPGME
jgi:hypothetical protein